jgi:hypothetical protein
LDVGGVMTSVKVAVVGGLDVDVALLEWLRGVRELRGGVQRERVTALPGQQGASGDLVVALTSTGAATALVTSLQVWLTNRHADVTVSVSVPDGRQVRLTAARVPDITQVRELLLAALAADVDAHSDPEPPPSSAGAVDGSRNDGQPPTTR